jgi:O-Antigen ligase/Tetratricopeptide repeat
MPLLDTVKRAKSWTPAAVVRILPVSALAVTTLMLAWREDGSIDRGDWLGYALLAGLVAAVAVAAGGVLGSRLAFGGCLALVALAGWDALSLTWSPVPSLARDEALLVLLYALALATPLVTIRARADRLLASGVVAAAICGSALALLVELRLDDHPGRLYYDGRLDAPLTYPNAAAAFLLVAFWPAVGLAATRSLPTLVRGAAVGGAAATLSCWLLAQSKGGGVGLLASALVFFALSPERVRALVPVVLAAVPTGIAVRALTEPYRVDDAELASTIRHAAGVALAVVAAAAAAGFLYALVDRRLELSTRARRSAVAAVAVLLVVAAMGGVGAFLAEVGSPEAFAKRQWRSFKHLPPQRVGSTHLVALGSNRYDFWRVSAHELERHPLAGLGARGFSVVYLRERRSNETPQRAHSVEADVLAETGVAGFALLALGLGLPLVAAARRARVSALDGTLLAAVVYWLAHCSVDWIWTFPAIGIPALVLLGCGAARDDPAPLPSRAILAAGATLAVVAVVGFAPPWLSSRLVDRAFTDPAGATADLRWARQLDPLSTAPLEAEAVLARPPGDVPPLERAVRMEPRSIGLRYRLGLAYLRAGRRAQARAELERAHELDPHDAYVEEALRRAR